MKIHELKLDTKYFNDVKSGKKNFEIRKNDRDFKVGDILNLHMWHDGGGIQGYAKVVSVDEISKIKDIRKVSREKSDTIKAKVLDIYSAEQINPDLDIVNSKNYVANLHVVFFLKDVSNVLKNYFQADKLPEEYVVMIIEVIE